MAPGTVEVQEVTVGHRAAQDLLGEDQHEPLLHGRPLVVHQPPHRCQQGDGHQQQRHGVAAIDPLRVCSRLSRRPSIAQRSCRGTHASHGRRFAADDSRGRPLRRANGSARGRHRQPCLSTGETMQPLTGRPGTHLRPVTAGSWRSFSLACIAPLVAAAVGLARRGWVPVGEFAQAELRVRDFWGHPPSLGAVGRLRTPTDVSSHPGPAAWWAMYPVYAAPRAKRRCALGRRGRDGRCMDGGARSRSPGARAGDALAVILGLGLLAWWRRWGRSTFIEPWNPWFAVMAFLCVVLGTWTWWRAIPGRWCSWWRAGSYCVQAHLGYAPRRGRESLTAVAGAVVVGAPRGGWSRAGLLRSVARRPLSVLPCGCCRCCSSSATIRATSRCCGRPTATRRTRNRALGCRRGASAGRVVPERAGARPGARRPAPGAALSGRGDGRDGGGVGVGRGGRGAASATQRMRSALVLHGGRRRRDCSPR